MSLLFSRKLHLHVCTTRGEMRYGNQGGSTSTSSTAAAEPLMAMAPAQPRLLEYSEEEAECMLLEGKYKTADVQGPLLEYDMTKWITRLAAVGCTTAEVCVWSRVRGAMKAAEHRGESTVAVNSSDAATFSSICGKLQQVVKASPLSLPACDLPI